jgi:4-amino-4-deoxy-L-arabinose transferase-like glycosyltransferase
VSGRRVHYAIVAVACVAPRLCVLLFERGKVLSEFTEKSDDFARTFVESGTFGFIPGEPSAYTQPLYGFLLTPLYALHGRHWLPFGLFQIALAVATALLVYEIGRRSISRRAGLAAAVVATLNPYLVWHDVHVNREIVDQPLAALLTLLTLWALKRRGLAAAIALGGAAGLAILGNSRLAALPLVLAAFLIIGWGRPRRAELAAGLAVLVAAAVAVTPWVVRNQVVIGCPALTTDSKALWKANNEFTYETLRRGQWIDQVPNPPDLPPTPEMAYGTYLAHGTITEVDECAQLTLYQRKVLDFWREHPGEKAKLSALAVSMLWDPRTTQTEGSAGSDGLLGTGRRWIAPVFVLALYGFAFFGARVVPRPFLALVVVLLGYQTLIAMVFVGATRYRAPWDFLLALLAAPAIVRVVDAVRER